MIPTGEALSVALVKKWYQKYPHVPLLNAYGPAEVSDDVTTCIVEPPGEGQLHIPVGRPIQNMRIYIIDESLMLCAPGVKGEICVAGIGVGRGYRNDDGKTRRLFIPNPFAKNSPDYAVLYRTGDMGYYLEDGNIVCLGRKDDQVKIRGFRIEPTEIAGQLTTYEGISESVVLVKEWNEDKYLIAYYVSNEAIEAKDLEVFLGGRLPYYMIPSFYIWLKELPITPNGKLDKRALPEPELKAAMEYVPPSGDMEKKLVEIWSQVLKIDPGEISVLASFFYLGGHSLNAITLINKIEKESGVRLSLKAFFSKATIRSAAEYIEIHSWLQNKELPDETHKKTLII